MKYALLVYTDPNALDGLSEQEQVDVHGQYMAIAQAPGIFGGERLGPTEVATTVRVQDGQTLVTDGPFADTKEVFGGYYLYEGETLDQAIELASKVPSTWMGGSIEIRPVVEMSN